MGWSRKGKFGIHTGTTLRNWPARKCTPIIGKPNFCGHFAVVKELVEEPDHQVSYNARNQVNIEFDDGIPMSSERPHLYRGYPDFPVIHSLNKHKRWLLPDIVKERVISAYEAEINEARDPVRKEQTVSDKLRITVVERHTTPINEERRGPDCFSLSSNYPSSSSTPLRKPTKSYAHVGDLKPNRSSERVPELYYEFLSPFPQKSWPYHQQVNFYGNYDFGRMVGSKSKKKSKGRRNKHYRHGCPRDEPINRETFDSVDVPGDHVQNVQNHVYQESDAGDKSAFVFPIGSYINDVIQRKAHKKCVKDCSHSKLHLQTSPSCQFGKGNAVYLDSDDQELKLVVPPFETETSFTEQTKTTNIPENTKISIQLLAKDIHPENLKQEFGDDYTESFVYPRKFIINTDLHKISPEVFPSATDCGLLFEVSEDTACGSHEIVNAHIALSLPKTEIPAGKLSESYESELNRLKVNGPLTTKAIANCVTEKIINEDTLGSNSSQSKNACYKKNASKAGKISIDLIHNVCQQKPEICEVKKAVQYSEMGASSEGLKPKHQVTFREKNLQQHETCCGICLLDVKLDKSVSTGLTCLLQCSHGFCNECWKHYICSCLLAGQGRISCPNYNCDTPVSAALVWSTTNSELYKLYYKLNSQLAIDRNPDIRPCPAPGCVHLARVPSTNVGSSNSLPVLCLCGELWCFACQKDAHWPASCEEAEVFRKQIKNYEELKASLAEGRITLVHVKRCPFCSYPIDKNHGCNHMSCRCGEEFCWDCLKPWTNHGWECTASVKDLEEVELVVNFGSARYNKYSKVSFSNLRARNGKNLTMARKLAEKAKRVENSHRFVFDSEAASSSRLVRSYIENGVSRHIETIFHFKYQAHFVLENIALAMAISKRKKMHKSLDEKIQLMEFIVGRMNEVLVEPAILTDERKLEQVEMLLKSGQKLIKIIHVLARANKKD